MSEIFSTRRLGLLIRNDAISGYRSLLTVSATLAGIVLIRVMLTGGSASDNEYFYLIWFTAMILLWGPIASSRSFLELHDKTKNEAYLLLPATALEKTIARLLAATIFFYIYLLIFTSVTSVVIESLSSLFFGRSNQSFRPFDPLLGNLLGHYLVIQSVYFLGAAWFRKTHFIKTTLAVTLVCIGLVLLTLAILRYVLVPSFDDLGFSMDNLYSLYHGVFEAAETGVITFYFVGLPVMCWTVAWLRIRETQVSDGV